MYRTDVLISASFSLCGFAAALISGAAAGGDSNEVITKGIFAMVGCYVVGAIAARVGLVAVREHMRDYRAQNPVPHVITNADLEAEDEAIHKAEVEAAAAAALGEQGGAVVGEIAGGEPPVDNAETAHESSTESRQAA